MMIPWIKCDMCEDYVCNYHWKHVADCDCPAIDTWAEHDMDPYGDIPEPVLDQFLSTHSYTEEHGTG